MKLVYILSKSRCKYIYNQ